MNIYKQGPSGPKNLSWFRRHKKLAITISIAGVLIIGGGVAAALYFLNKPAPVPPAQIADPEPEPEPIVYYSPLTGKEVKSLAATTQAVTGVMIENSPDARPQSGLKGSGVVFEAVAEGGITRFLALYQQEKPTLIGPVRSVRSYYVDWVAAFNASIAHVGGSPKALAIVRSGGYRDIDQFFNAGTYWRATDRYAPHNVYTNFKNLDALNKAKGYTTSKFTGFVRDDSTAAEKTTATRISITISSATYNSSYIYNAKSNTYYRSQGGAAHNDREKGRIAPRVVIAMELPMYEDRSGRTTGSIGSGKVYIFQNGIVKKGTWKKSSRTAQITFTDKDGDPIPLARGQTWITAVPTANGDVTWR
jgi:hypothetical protein